MNRQEYLEKYFTNIQLDADYPDWFYVRRSILQFIQNKLMYMKGNLLDVGCGIMPYKELILNGGKVTSYTGLDFENSLDEEYAMGKPDFFWKGEIIPAADNSYDTILATEFFEHCPEPERIMKEIRRVLRKDGVLIFTVPFLWNLHLVPYDEYRYTPYSLKRHLTFAGYSEINLEALGGFDASLAQMLAIWLHQRPMSKLQKKILSTLLLPIIKKLIEKDKIFDKDKLFFGGSMITGIGGICFNK